MSANPKLIDVSTPAHVADALGHARAALKDAKAEVDFLEGLLKAQKLTEVEGDLFRVKIAYGIETSRTDWRAVAAHFKPSRQLVTAHTKVGLSDRVTVTAHVK